MLGENISSYLWVVSRGMINLCWVAWGREFDSERPKTPNDSGFIIICPLVAPANVFVRQFYRAVSVFQLIVLVEFYCMVQAHFHLQQGDIFS